MENEKIDLEKEMSSFINRVNKEKEFQRELSSLMNRYSKESGSNTPDFILANYLIGCLDNFNRVTQEREKWYGREQKTESDEDIR